MIIFECDYKRSFKSIPKPIRNVWNNCFVLALATTDMISVESHSNRYDQARNCLIRKKTIRYFDLAVELTVIDPIFRIEASSQEEYDTILLAIILYGFLQ